VSFYYPYREPATYAEDAGFLVQIIDFDALWQEDDDQGMDASDAKLEKPAAVKGGGDAEMGEAE